MENKEEIIKMNPALGTCCPEMRVTICNGCGHDHGTQYLIDLLASAEKTIRQEVAEDVETYLSSSAPIHGISFKEFTRLKSKYLSEQKRGKGSK